MDIDEDNYVTKRCYQSDKSVIDNLNIVYNATSTTTILWNKIQIFVYEDLNFEAPTKVIIPNFLIRRLLLFNNYLVCLDRSGNIHISPMKFKNPSPKRLKTGFQTKEQGVVAIRNYDQDYLISLKLEHNNLFFCFHKINADFQIVKRILIIDDADWSALKEANMQLISHNITQDDYILLRNHFNLLENFSDNYCFLIMAFDKFEIYGCILNLKLNEDEIKLIKLYSCPAEICSMEINYDDDDLNIIIGLKIGTLIKLSLKNPSKEPFIEHLNAAIYKMHTMNHSIMYSDGISMWKATDIFSDKIKFTKYFVRQVKDFTKIGDQIICTTYSNLIYTFQMDDENCLTKNVTEEYCPAEKVLNNIDCYHKIMEEVKKNDNLIKRLSKDSDYITSISLANRQDIMDTFISTKVMVCDNYNDITQNFDVRLTEELFNYYDKESLLFLVNISTEIEHKFNEILSNVLGDLKVHITLSTETKLLKTTSLKITEQLKKLSLLIPLRVKDVNFTEITVVTKILTNVPGAYDERQIIRVVLYRKNITLSSEHFIKRNNKSTMHFSLKEPQESANELLIQAAKNQYGNKFDFIDSSNRKAITKHWFMYVKLPGNYTEILKSAVGCLEPLDSAKADLVKQLSTEEFHKSKGDVAVAICNTQVKIEIEDDGFLNPLLKITGNHLRVVLNLRKFFGKLLYNDFVKGGPGTEFISSSFYTSVENLQREIRDCIQSSSNKDLLPLIQQFERRIIGALPM